MVTKSARSPQSPPPVTCLWRLASRWGRGAARYKVITVKGVQLLRGGESQGISQHCHHSLELRQSAGQHQEEQAHGSSEGQDHQHWGGEHYYKQDFYTFIFLLSSV